MSEVYTCNQYMVRVTNLSSLFLIYDHMMKQTFGKLVTGWEEMIISLRANGAGVRPELD